MWNKQSHSLLTSSQICGLFGGNRGKGWILVGGNGGNTAETKLRKVCCDETEICRMKTSFHHIYFYLIYVAPLLRLFTLYQKCFYNIDLCKAFRCFIPLWEGATSSQINSLGSIQVTWQLYLFVSAMLFLPLPSQSVNFILCHDSYDAYQYTSILTM